MATGVPVRRTTTTASTEDSPSIASSTVSFSGTMWPRRMPASAVTTTFGRYDSSRSRSDRAENPEKTVLKSAPIRKQARTATMASARFGVKIATASPLLTPSSLSTFAHLFDFDGQHPVGEEAGLAVFAFPDERQTVVRALRQMAVDQIEGRIADAADEVLEVRKVAFEDRVPRAHPFELAGDVGPELFGMLPRAASAAPRRPRRCRSASFAPERGRVGRRGCHRSSRAHHSSHYGNRVGHELRDVTLLARFHGQGDVLLAVDRCTSSACRSPAPGDRPSRPPCRSPCRRRRASAHLACPLRSADRSSSVLVSNGPLVL